MIEDLDFAGARSEGRERYGNRPSRGRRGRGFRRAVAGIPTARFRDRLVQMAANAGLHVIVTDPAYTSRWGAEHWLGPLREHHPKATGHHAAALVTGRRGLGHRARRRATGNHTAPAEAARPAQARPRTTPAARPAPRKPATPPGPRQPPGTKTRRPHRIMAGNQAAQDRPGPPVNQDYLPLAQQERLLLVFVRRVRTQAPSPRPPLITPDRMGQGTEPIEVHAIEGIDRETHHTLLLFALPVIRARSYRYAKNPVSLFSVVAHCSTPGYLALPVARLSLQNEMAAPTKQTPDGGARPGSRTMVGHCHHRRTEKRKVGSSTLALTTSSDQLILPSNCGNVAS